MRATDETGKRYGRLLVLRLSEKRGNRGQRMWDCLCDCGTEKAIKVEVLRTGHASSCGCLRRDLMSIHGHSGGGRCTPAYSAWHNMKHRCDNPKDKRYASYGGRGIGYDPSWATFAGFLADMGDPPEGLTLDRIDNDGNYCKANCRWATRKQQSRNTRMTRLVEFDGERLCISDWAERVGLPRNTLDYRLGAGWPVGRALTTPVMR